MKIRIQFAFLIIVLFTACENAMDHERYQRPDYLQGPIVAQLESKGNFNLFIEMLDAVGLKKVFNETGMFTVFAPGDEAVKTYLSELGYNSIDELPEELLKKIIYNHIIDIPLSTRELIELYPGQFGANASMHHKVYYNRKKTRNRFPQYEYLNPADGQVYTITNRNKYLPFYCDELFDFYGVPGSDYEQLFPNSKFIGLNIANAAMIEPDIPSENGWIHIVDQVLKPMENIEEHLKNESDYSIFYGLMQRFAGIKQTNLIGDSEKEYEKIYSLEVNIATEEPSTQYYDEFLNQLVVYAPENDSLTKYFENTFELYNDFNEIPDVLIKYILDNHLYFINNQTMKTFTYPSSLSEFEVRYGEYESLSSAEQNYSIYLSNGIMHGTKKVLSPNMFESITRRMFTDPNYSSFMHMVEQLKLVNILSLKDLKYTIVMPSNDAIEAYGVYMEDGAIVEKPEGFNMTDFVNSHILTEEHDVETESGYSYVSNMSGNYVRFNDALVDGGGGTPIQIDEIDREAYNGIVYCVEDVLYEPENDMRQVIETNFSQFYQLCIDAGLVSADGNAETGYTIYFNFLEDNVKYTVFTPTNSVIEAAQAAGQIPTDKEELKQFVKGHFVYNKVIHTDRVYSQECETTHIDYELTDKFTTFYSKVLVENDGTNYTVTGATTAQVLKSDLIDAMCSDGVVHAIDNIVLID